MCDGTDTELCTLLADSVALERLIRDLPPEEKRLARLQARRARGCGEFTPDERAAYEAFVAALAPAEPLPSPAAHGRRA